MFCIVGCHGDGLCGCMSLSIGYSLRYLKVQLSGWWGGESASKVQPLSVYLTSASLRMHSIIIITTCVHNINHRASRIATLYSVACSLFLYAPPLSQYVSSHHLYTSWCRNFQYSLSFRPSIEVGRAPLPPSSPPPSCHIALAVLLKCSIL